MMRRNTVFIRSNRRVKRREARRFDTCLLSCKISVVYLVQELCDIVLCNVAQSPSVALEFFQNHDLLTSKQLVNMR